MSASSAWWAGVVYSIDATKEDIGRAGFNAGLEAAAKMCEEEASNPDLPLAPIERYRASVLHDAILALKDKA